MIPGMNLDTLRARLAAVDAEILRLVGERLAVAAAIGREKAARGLPTRDYGQEREVLERASRIAAAHGVSESLAAEILLSLIRGALLTQEQDRVAAAAAGSGKRALVIGGAGKMGTWFARFLTSQGYNVQIADPVGTVDGLPHRAAWDEGALDHDLILVAAPLRRSGDILCGLAARRPPGLVFDIGSLKTPLRNGLYALRDAGVRATSLHPMFGPDTELLSGRHVVFVDLGRADATEEAKSLFAPTTAALVDLDLESHDRVIAYVLGLSHAVNIAFFTALAESGRSAPGLSTLSSTTFDHQLAGAARVAAENPHLYFDIQALNDYGEIALDALYEAVARMRDAVRARDQAEFVAIMERGRRYLEERNADPAP